MVLSLNPPKVKGRVIMPKDQQKLGHTPIGVQEHNTEKKVLSTKLSNTEEESEKDRETVLEGQFHMSYEEKAGTNLLHIQKRSKVLREYITLART